MGFDPVGSLEADADEAAAAADCVAGNVAGF
jgi:hypothetical protein